MYVPVWVGVPDIVFTLLLKSEITPDGKPELEEEKLPLQIGVTVWTIEVIALLAVTVCDSDPLVSATVNSFPQTGLLDSANAEFREKKSGSDVTSVTHQPERSWLNDEVFLWITNLQH